MKINLNSKKYIIGIVIGIAVTMVMIFIFSAIMLIFKMDRAYSSFFATVSVSLGAYMSAYYISEKSESKGYLIGFLTGLIYFAVVTFLSFITTKSHIGYNTAFHFVIIILSATVGGIMGVNKKKTKIL